MLPEGEFLKSASIMVDVDALFDTRASLLDMLHPRILAMALAAGYETREEDAFHKVGFEKFKKIYEARDVRCLEDAPITAIASILMSFARGPWPLPWSPHKRGGADLRERLAL